MTVHVDPDQLDGYAALVERNAGAFVDPLGSYCAANCGHTDGMTGLLTAVRPLVEQARDGVRGLFASGERDLYQVAVNLRAAATAYRAHDEAAAERIWLTLPRREPPDGYTERDDLHHPGDYADAYRSVLAIPARRDDVAKLIGESRATLGVIEEWAVRYAHVSVATTIGRYLTGDWDTVRLNAAGYAALATPDGVLTIRENLRHGMDSLSTSWDGPAATAFDFTIRQRWVPAIEAVAHLLDLEKEVFEQLADIAEQTYRACVEALAAFEHWVVEKCLRIVRLVASLVHGAQVLEEVAELVEHLMTFSHEITLLFELLRGAIETASQAVRTAGAAVTTLDDLWAPGGSRLDPVKVG